MELIGTKRIRLLVAGLAAVLGLAVLSGTANAGTTTPLNFSEFGFYFCPVSCATSTTFTIDGAARDPNFGLMLMKAKGTITGFDGACAIQAEDWSYTLNDGSKIFLSTTSDTICPTSNPNVFLENATFAVTGGTGRFRNATGSGTFTYTVYGQPQVGTGTLTGTITY